MSKINQITKKFIGLVLVLTLVLQGTSAFAGSKKVSLKDDFYEATNMEIMEGKKINPETGEWSVTSDLMDEVDKKVNDIIKELAENVDKYPYGSMERKVADFYLTAKDMDKRNEVGLKALEEPFKKVEDSKTIKELGKAWAELIPYSLSLPVLTAYDVNPKNAHEYIHYIYGDTTDYNFSGFTKEEGIKTKEYIAEIFKALGKDKKRAKRAASRVFTYLETMSAAASYPPNRDKFDKLDEYEYYSLEEVDDLYSNLDMKEYLSINQNEISKFAKIQMDEFVVEDEDFAKALNQLYLNDSQVRTMKDVTYFMVVDGLLSQYQCMPENLEKANIKLHNYLYGLEEEFDSEKTALKTTKYLLEGELGKLYAKKYFTEDMKDDATKMVLGIKESYRKKITDSKWMSKKTKEGALKKLDNMIVNVGYPDYYWGEDILTANIVSPTNGGDCLTNTLEYMKNGGVPQTPATKANKAQWPMSVAEVNAMYDPMNNSITFPAGILQEPFYKAGGDESMNLGSMGVTVAHEITHAFDNDGSNYDEIGNFRNWWTKADKKAYKKLQKKMIKYFNKYEINGMYVDGELTLPENIADLGGMDCVIEIVKAEKSEYKKFFESYSNSWAGKYSSNYLEALMTGDEHAPDKVRVNGILSNFDIFYRVYGITSKDGMYVPKNQRVHIW